MYNMTWFESTSIQKNSMLQRLSLYIQIIYTLCNSRVKNWFKKRKKTPIKCTMLYTSLCTQSEQINKSTHLTILI